MEYRETKPCNALAPYIHSFWELEGSPEDGQWERIFPDGCPGLLLNLGDRCITDSGSVAMDHGKTYAVGTMNTFKDSFVHPDTHLMGVCLKPAAFSTFYNYAPQNELINSTVQFETSRSFDFDKIIKDPYAYLNRFFIDRIGSPYNPIQAVIQDIQDANGSVSINHLAKKNGTTIRQLERNFRRLIGITPKEFANIIRFQHALAEIKNSPCNRSLLDIAVTCGYYDHAHLTNEIKRNTGLTPSQL